MLNIRLITPPAVEPVSLATMKAFLVVDSGFTADDALITSLIQAARTYAEQAMNRAIFNQTFLLTRDYFPIYFPTGTTSGTSLEYLLGVEVLRSQTIQLPWPNLVSVSSIKYTDQTGTDQTIDPSLYLTDTSSEPGRIAPIPQTTWPTSEYYAPGSVQITFVAGSYGDGVTTNTCPQSIVIAIQLLVGSWYGSRSATSVVNMSQIPFGVDVLLNQYKFHGLGL